MKLSSFFIVAKVCITFFYKVSSVESLVVTTSGPTNFVKVLDFDDPTSSSGTLSVEVKAGKQAVLWLGETSDPGNGGADQASSYGITLGGWDNTRSIINGGYFHSDLAVYDGAVLTEDAYSSFSISWNKDVLKVERLDFESGDWVELMKISDRTSDGYNYDIKHLIVGWGDEEAIWYIGEPVAITDDPAAEFIYSLTVQKGVAKKLRTKTCLWLSRRDETTLTQICDGGIEYPGATAATVCPITCSVVKDDII